MQWLVHWPLMLGNRDSVANVFPRVKCRVLINSRFGVIYSNFSFLTPTLWKVSIEKYGKTPTLSGGQHFTPIFKILVRTLKCMSFVYVRNLQWFMKFAISGSTKTWG